MFHHQNISNEVGFELFKKLTTDPIRGKDKMKTCKQLIKTNFYGQDIPYDVQCNVTAVLKVVCRQGKNYHPQV